MKSLLATVSLVALLFGVITAGAADRETLVAANSSFAFDLMRQLARAQPGANIFISPYSVSSALQMTAVGAGGTTRQEMRRTLKTAGMTAGSLSAAFRDLDQQFNRRTDVTLNIANSIWFQKGLHLKPAFTDINKKFFHASLAGVDFDDPHSAITINHWADAMTQGKIKEVVQFPFPRHTRLILADAIYFKGKWEVSFEKRLTGPRDFHLADGHSRQVPMMTQAGQFFYQETPDVQAVKLPYRGGLEMELYLPPAGSSLWNLPVILSARQKIEAGFARRQGTVVLPTFKLEYDVRLNEPLQALGMKAAFTDGADFSGMAGEPLEISEVRQKSYVEVNEEGTEAAAVTTVGVRATAVMRPPADRFMMVLDHPFLFMISDADTGSILFMGMVNDPSAAR